MQQTPEQQAVNENTSSERLQELANLSLELARLVAQNCSASSELLRELGVGSDPVVRQNLAMNPNTPPSLLVELAVQRELASDDFAKIIEGIASNPNTPTDVLLDLGAKFPEQLLNNPVFFLLILENPNLLKEMPWQTRNSLYDYEGCPEPLRSLLEAAGGGSLPF